MKKSFLISVHSYKNILWLTAAIWLLLAGAGYPQEFPLELKVRAVLLKKIVRFVDWPTAVNDEAESSITLGFLGENPVWPVFQAMADQGKLGNLVLRKIEDLNDVDCCKVLVIGSDYRYNLKEVFDLLRGSPTLTISEMKGFAEAGGMVQLYKRKDKIHFKINKDFADAAGLNIRANFLRIAEIVSTN